ncbi:MAG: hypothetical protein LBH25_05485 [Fibromonadaceae bacterium]|jgi:hypothetical protein|nr:hypothetical protein [Fibromonadaceae bacterium]
MKSIFNRTNFSNIAVAKISTHLALVLLGGSLGIDAFLRFIFQIFIFILPFLIIKKTRQGLLLFLIRVNIVCFWIDVVSILTFPSESWNHIRGCAGGNFLTFSFSFFWLIRKQNFGQFLEALIGLLSPPIALYTVAFGINNSFVSWAYFYD